MAGLRGVSVPLVKARLVEVTGRLQQGASLDARWPAPLDGLLASVARRRRLGQSYGQIEDHHIDWLPLARWQRKAANQWFWLASCAEPVGTSAEDVHWWHKRFRHQAAEQVASDLPPVIREGQGRFRSYRMPVVVTAALALRWWAAGDVAGIEEMLTSVWAVGKKWGTGEGAVIGWSVADHGPLASWSGEETVVDMAALRRVVATDNGCISRPMPSRVSPILGLDAETTDTVFGTARPPYWRPPQMEVAQGGFARPWREVIAPWVTVPSVLPSPHE